LDSVALYSFSENSLPECEPSQKGWALLLPQAHQQ
jgi:hypothetical protein